MWSPELISTTIVGVFTIVVLIVQTRIFWRQTTILKQQTKILELEHQPKLFIIDGTVVDIAGFLIYKFSLQNDSDTPATNIQYYFKLFTPKNIDTQLSQFNDPDMYIRPIGMVTQNKPTTIYTDPPIEIHRRLEPGSNDPLKEEESLEILLCGLIKCDNLTDPIIICEDVYVGQGHCQMNSVLIDHIKLKKFIDTITQKMNV
jgi:hypothetical protein